MSDRELPYIFDLTYDVKTYEEVDRIANGGPHCSSATPRDLFYLFQSEDLPVPASLLKFKAGAPTKDIWVCREGTWQDYEPPYEERHRYYKTSIQGWLESDK